MCTSSCESNVDKVKFICAKPRCCFIQCLICMVNCIGEVRRLDSAPYTKYSLGSQTSMGQLASAACIRWQIKTWKKRTPPMKSPKSTKPWELVDVVYSCAMGCSYRIFNLLQLCHDDKLPQLMRFIWARLYIALLAVYKLSFDFWIYWFCKVVIHRKNKRTQHIMHMYMVVY